MGGYLANFTVYTMAMTGLICFAVFIYKKIMDGSLRTNNSKFLSIEETMNLNPRKTLHIVRAGNEKFLIASDVDRTTLISKLDNNSCNQTFNKTINDGLTNSRIEHFKNIEQELLPDTQELNTQTSSTIEIQNYNSNVQSNTNHKTVHLELIKTKNPQGAQLRKNMDRREPRQFNQQKAITLDFQNPQSHGFSTMKEMAKKINEL